MPTGTSARSSEVEVRETETARAKREGFNYRPLPQEYEGAYIKPFEDRKQEIAYEAWRRDMIYQLYGPQTKPSGPAARAQTWAKELAPKFAQTKKVHAGKPLVLGNSAPWLSIGYQPTVVYNG